MVKVPPAKEVKTRKTAPLYKFISELQASSFDESPFGNLETLMLEMVTFLKRSVSEVQKILY